MNSTPLTAPATRSQHEEQDEREVAGDPKDDAPSNANDDYE